ncbi:MAG TPA: pyruvate, phosphate dikinase, partial [Synergistaceae bacterium]|nr:pyruvate, phosphate dikinase [Synergistaceae bacterium]
SIYFGIDIFHQFLESVPSLDLLISQNEPERLEEVFLKTPLPKIATEAVRNFLLDMHDPVVIRSSSRLEDSDKHSFAGKYLTTFMSNDYPSLEDRVSVVEREIRKIYARIYFPQAVSYRKKHCLGDDDMGIIVMRMSGRWHGRYYYPTIAGVGYSQNFRRWNKRVKQKDGVLRIVFGLGTMSTKRGYARTISLTNVYLRPDGQNPEKIAIHSQERFHVIDRENPNELTTLDIKKEWPQLIEHHPDFDAYAQVYCYDSEGGCLSSLMKTTKKIDVGSKVCLTFDNFPKKYPNFFERMKKTLPLLESSMGLPADIEFAYEPLDDSFCLIQSRPCWCQTCTEEDMPDLGGKRILLKADRMVTPGVINDIPFLVYVDHRIYYSNPDFFKVARGIGEINSKMNGQKFIFVSPGRVGSSNPELGVPVKYDELTNCCCIVELGVPRLGFMPELSYGTHFFSDLAVDNVLYMPVFEGESNNLIDQDWFRERKWEEGPHTAIRIYRGSFSAYMDGETNQGVIIDNSCTS